MLVSYFYCEEELKPNWKNGEDKITQLLKKWKKQGLPTDMSYWGEPQTAANSLREQLKEIRAVFTNPGDYQELSVFYLGPYKIFLTGGMSWGDDPSNLFSTINDLSQSGILAACGFDQPIPDAVNILRKILAVDQIRPLLIGLDEELDEMLDQKGRKRGHKV